MPTHPVIPAKARTQIEKRRRLINWVLPFGRMTKREESAYRAHPAGFSIH